MDQDDPVDQLVPVLDGTEVVTCDIKVPINGSMAPPSSAPVVTSITPVFVADGPHWLFTLTASETQALAAGNYIFDVKVVYQSPLVVKSQKIVIRLDQDVTE